MATGLIYVQPGLWWDPITNQYYENETGTIPVGSQDELPFSQQPTSDGLGTAFWNPDIQSPEKVESYRDLWADMQTTVDRMNMLDPWYQALGLTGRGLAGQMAPETQARFAFGRFTPGFATTPGFGATEAGPDVTTTFRGFAEGRPSNWTHTDWLNGMKALRNYGVIPNPIDPKDWNNMSAEDKSAQVQNHMSMLLADGVDQNIVAAWDNIKSFEQVVTLIEGVIGISRMSGSMRQVYKNGIYRELARIERDNPGLADKPAQLLAYVSLGGFNLNGLGIVPKEQNFQTPIKPGDKLSSTGNPKDQEGASGAIGGGQGKEPEETTPVITPKTKEVNQSTALAAHTVTSEVDLTPEQGGTWVDFADRLTPAEQAAQDLGPMGRRERTEDVTPFTPTDPYADTLIDTSGEGIRTGEGETYPALPTPPTEVDAMPSVADIFQPSFEPFVSSGEQGVVAPMTPPTVYPNLEANVPRPAPIPDPGMSSNIVTSMEPAITDFSQLQHLGLPTPETRYGITGQPVPYGEHSEPWHYSKWLTPMVESGREAWEDSRIREINFPPPEFMGGSIPETTSLRVPSMDHYREIVPPYTERLSEQYPISTFPKDMLKDYSITYPEHVGEIRPDLQSMVDYTQPTSPTNIGYGGPGVGMGQDFVEPGSWGVTGIPGMGGSGYNIGELYGYGINPFTGMPYAQTGTISIRQGY